MGRGNANGIMALATAAMVLATLMVLTETSSATQFTVGEQSGWTGNMVKWPTGKTFKAGDVLVFNYNKERHNVVAVNHAGYTTCTVPAGSKAYKSGSDRIELRKGANYFLCSYPGHRRDEKHALE